MVLVPLAFRLEDEIGLASVAVRGLESMARADAPREGWTRLREACAGVCAALVRRLIESGQLPCANADQALRVLGGDPVEVFDRNGSARLIGEWVRQYDAQLRKPMTEQAMRHVPAIPAALEAWVDAMLNHALDGGMSRMAVLRMLAADETSEGPVTWLRLLGLWRPVVLLVDHLDAYYRKPEFGLRIASLLLDISEMDGVHVVLSLNQDVWQATFGHHLPSAMEDRLTASQMLLRGIGEAEAARLLRLRLEWAGASAEELLEFEGFIDVKRYFLGRPLGSVSARSFLRHAAKQWAFFQQTQASPPMTAPLEQVVPNADEMASAVPLLIDTVPDDEPVQAYDAAIFDSGTTEQMKRMAEGLAEPLAALPQQDQHPLAASNGTHRPPQAAPEAAGNGGHGGDAPCPQFSPDSESAFKSLREMLGKLRQPSAAEPAPPETGAADVAARLASVMKTAAPARAEPGNEALRGRFEALRLQMSAEADSLPLDYTKLAELIRLAGKRFPIVRFSEHELPSMAGRHVMCWSLQGMEIVFGLANFADASYWRTLAGFAAGRLAELNTVVSGDSGSRLKIATFRTGREQAAWAALQQSGAFPAELASNVDVIQLEASGVAALYAMQCIIKESESGALQSTPAEVMSVLARELDFFWKRVTRAV